ncbi:peroxiredoxin family protein [Geomicrobium sediminis]|uniref:Peroxiredoxin n=1 Tax=Geomicrobium sediminis TaxID=1347788 RepID=A0ABS2P7Y9_9BACL|nr:TlpA disulfide reductase family protein [Geomicrobium sediminis]MBM7631535.1 peroxiredoxin [Geomicrobium sediminis]
MEFMKSIVYLCFIGLMLCFPLQAAATGPTNFTLTSTDGEQIELSDFDGKRKLAVFFTTWCEVCQEEIAELALTYDELVDKNVQVLAINMTHEERSKEEVKVIGEQLPYPVLYDEGGSVSKQYGVLGVPLTVLLDEKNEESARFFGPIQKEKLHSFLNEADRAAP